MKQTALPPALTERLDLVFGVASDPMPLLTERARAFLPELKTIVWEGDATSFQFLYVNEEAAEMLGYAPAQWTSNPTFWADVVVHPEDRDNAVAYCALCTGKNQDHDFVYRAVTADGRVLWLHDVVRVVVGPRRIATHLRGIMIDVSDQYADDAVLAAFAPAIQDDATSQSG